MGHLSCKTLHYNDMQPLSYSAVHMASTERFGSRLREWRNRRRLSQEVLGEKIGSDGPRVHRLEKGSENPTLETLDKIADALEIDVSELLNPRPEGATGRADNRSQDLAILEELLSVVDRETPAQDSWRGDVLQAIATLNRALRRAEPGENSSASDRSAAKPGR